MEHVSQGRYHALLCQESEYLKELSRYTVLNPVRAGLVEHPGHWLWSSYGALIGTVDAPAWLDRDTVLAQFGSVREAAIRAFEDFVLAGISQSSPFPTVRNQLFLGSAEFCKLATRGEIRGDVLEIKRTQRRAFVRQLEDYFLLCPDRQEAMAQKPIGKCPIAGADPDFDQASWAGPRAMAPIWAGGMGWA